MKTSIALLLLTLLLRPALAGTRDATVAVESDYLGQGRIRYTIRTLDDPFYASLNVAGFGLYSPAGIVAESTPPRWTNTPPGAPAWSLESDAYGTQSRPYTASFVVQSSQTSFKRADKAAYVLISLSTVGGFHGYEFSENISGYMNADVLVPCPPEEADGSPTYLISGSKFFTLPDIQITGLLRTDGRPTGITYSYPEQSTVRLEATRDFSTWTNVAYIYGEKGVTTWTNSQPLDLYGSYYRVRLVAEGHAAALPPLNSTGPILAASAMQPLNGLPSPAPRSLVLSSRPRPDGMEVTFATKPGSSYNVTLLDFAMKPTSEIKVQAAQTSTQVLLPTTSTEAGLIRITELSAQLSQ